MSQQISLPSGNTVVLRDPTTLTHGDRKKMFAAASNQEGLLQNLSMIDGLIAILIKEWTFDMIIPSIHLASLDKLSIADYDALAKAAQDAQNVVFPDFKDDTNPDSPLDNSAASNT